MVILVMCTNPECCELFHVSDPVAGTEVCCPQCGTTQRVKAQPKTDASAPMDVIGIAAPKGRGKIPQADDADDKMPPPSSATAATAAETTEEKFPHSLELEEDDDDAPGLSPAVRPANPPTNNRASVDAQEVSYELSDLDDEPPAEDTTEPDLEAIPSAAPHIRAPGSSAPLNTPVKFTEMDDPIFETRNTQPADQDLLDLKPSGAIILSIGLGGMLVGLMLGMLMFPWHPVLNAYLGGGLGWIMGFTIAFLLIGAYEKKPERLRCGLCGCVSSIHTTSCGLCGAPLSAEDSSPMLWACLRAGHFAVNHWSYSLSLAVYVVLTYAIHWGLLYLWTQYADFLQPWWLVRYVLDGLVLAMLVSYCVRYFLAVIDIQYRTQDTMPKPPAFFSLSGLIQTIHTLLMLATIVLPLITLPLLPLGLLQQATTEKHFPSWRALVRTMRRYPKDFSLLWLFLLLWSAGMLLSVLLVILAFDRLAEFFDSSDSAQNLLQNGILVIRVAVATMVGYCLLVAVCRCIGRFGRFCPLA